MGEVYLARRTGAGGFQRLTALKVILPERADEPRLRQLFLREGTTAGALNHRAIVQVFDLDIADDRLYLAMEYLRGMSVRQLLGARGGRLEWPVAAWIASEVARGLDAAHETRRGSGLVHGDISPSNLMCCADGAVKILDFGLARPAGGERSTSGWEGKLAYLPPESANGGACDHRVDIYSLGVTLYHMLTGEQPFLGRNDLETVQRILQSRVEPPSTAAEVPAELDEVVLKAIARQPSGRFASAGEMADALDRVVAGRFGASPLADLVTDVMTELGIDEEEDEAVEIATPAPVPLPARRRYAIAGLVTALAAVAAALAVALVLQRSERANASAAPRPAAEPAPALAIEVAPEPPAIDPEPPATTASRPSDRPRRGARRPTKAKASVPVDAGVRDERPAVKVHPDMPVRF
jgi:serine/threonine protein kinase